MENKLKKLFDYQKFEQNKDLQDVIDSTVVYDGAVSLSDDLLGSVAGGQNKEEKKKEIKDE